jgi:Transglycosylase SLT domain
MIDLENTDPASLSPHQQEVIGKTIAEAQNQGIDPNYAIAIANQESAFNHLKDGKINCSDAGACGAFQLMPDVAKRLGVNPRNIDQNIKGGISLLKENLNRYDNNDLLATVAYNTSEATRNKFMETGDPKVLPKETLDYVRNIHSQHPLQGVLALGAENNPFLSDQPNPIVQEIKQERDQQPVAPAQSPQQTQSQSAPTTPVMDTTVPAVVGASAGLGARLIGGKIQPPQPITFPATTGTGAQIAASQDKMAKTLANAHAEEALAEQAARQAAVRSFVLEAQNPATVSYMQDLLRSYVPNPEAAQLMGVGRGSQEDKLGTTGKQGSQYSLEAKREAEARRVLSGQGTAREAYLAAQGPQTATPSGVQISRKLVNEVYNQKYEPIAQQIQSARKTADELDSAHLAARLQRETAENAAKELALRNAQLAKQAEPSLLTKALKYGQKGIENVGYGISKVPGLQTLGNVVGGVGAGYDLAQTINRARQGDIPGAAISGLGAVSGGLSMIPTPITKGLGLAGGLTSAGLEYLRNRYQNQEAKP